MFTKIKIKKATGIITKVWAILSAFFMVLTLAIECPGSETEGATLTSYENLVLEKALFRGQGCTTDGEHFYFSGNFFLTKTTLDAGETLEKNIMAIPAPLLAKGCNHIGGISYHDGKIYAGVEDGSDYLNPYIVVYDAETLKYIEYFRMPWELHVDGIPWCAVDAPRGYLYTAEWSNAKQLNVFDLETMELVKTVPLSMELDRIQGAEMFDGKLYCSQDTKADGKKIFVVDPDTGEASLLFTRNVGADTEAEGMTVLPTEDGPVFCVMDLGATRTNMIFRRYVTE